MKRIEFDLIYKAITTNEYNIRQEDGIVIIELYTLREKIRRYFRWFVVLPLMIQRKRLNQR
jgi:hypothetical protein